MRHCDLTIEGLEPEEIKSRLAKYHSNVSVSVVESTRLDMEARNLTSMVRASVHYYNSEEEIERFCKQIEKML